MSSEILGIHHVTAIAADPQRNLDFYTGALGLRLVKVTVNFDDPSTYHLYYGDRTGRPGSLLTFFPWRGVPRGRSGAGQVVTTSFAIPRGAVGYWAQRLEQHGVRAEQPHDRFGDPALAFADPDGLALELIATEGGEQFIPWEESPVPPEQGIHGVHSVTLWEGALEPTAELLSETLGFRRIAADEDRVRFAIGAQSPSTLVDVRTPSTSHRGVLGAGTVHHVAWRTPTSSTQADVREAILRQDIAATAVVERVYFQSVYFREPGGALFEVATDEPGFTVDEPVEQLGSRLTLPPWLEPMRERVQRSLPTLKLPEPVRAEL